MKDEKLDTIKLKQQQKNKIWTEKLFVLEKVHDQENRLVLIELLQVDRRLKKIQRMVKITPIGDQQKSKAIIEKVEK